MIACLHPIYFGSMSLCLNIPKFVFVYTDFLIFWNMILVHVFWPKMYSHIFRGGGGGGGLDEAKGGGRVVRKFCLSYITGASNWYWLTVGQGLLSL